MSLPALFRAAAFAAFVCIVPAAVEAAAGSLPPDIGWLGPLLEAGGAALDPAAADPDWHIRRPTANSTGQVPVPREYQLLEEALGRLVAEAGAGGWPAVPGGGPLGLGVREPRVEALRARLRASGDYDSEMGADPWFFDTGMDKAVRRFQRLHELPVDGIVSSRTLDAINVPLGERIAQLAVTVERWRWLPRDLGPTYVWVNIPRARLDVFTDGRSVLGMPVVVGHRDRPTPSLSGDLKRVVFNPTWSVPTVIATEDLLRRQQSDPQFLPAHRIRVFSGSGDTAREVDPSGVDWDRLGPGRFPYRLVQDAGPGNSLGRIKLSFQNPYDIYLHDTPAKGMFGLSMRSLSSGCVRLENAAALATMLLSGERPWTDADTATHSLATRTETINLKRGLPVYLVYLTAWAGDDGEIHYGRDLYGRDERALAALGRRR